MSVNDEYNYLGIFTDLFIFNFWVCYWCCLVCVKL